MTQDSGFAFVETILALAVFVVLLGLSMPFLVLFHNDSLFTDAVEQVVQDLRRAQTLAIAGEGDTAHGVFFDPAAEQWVLFTGTAYTAGAATNEVHSLPASVDLVSVTLTGGGASVIFDERAGRTLQPGTIVLRSGPREVTITVAATGSVTR